MTAHLELNIDWHRSFGERNPLLFGYFLEHFHRQIYGGIFQPTSSAGSSGLRLDVIEAIRRLQPAVVRWPGGCFASSYHWRDGIGPQRLPSFDKAWRAEEPNTFGTDEFVAFCRAVGAEPYICTNGGTGTPEEMSDWVEYCNLSGKSRNARLRVDNGNAQPFGVRLWSIGNENYGDWEIGARDAAEWARYVRESAKMMRRVDDRVVLSAPACGDIDWDVGLLRCAGEQLDLLAVHGYAAHGGASYEQMVARAGYPEQKIARAEQMLELVGLTGRVRIAFDEWNPRHWHHPGHAGRGRPNLDEWARNDDNSTYTMADAVLHACFLNSALRHCQSVAITNFSPLVNTRGPIYAYDGGVVLRPTYHVCELYASRTLPEVLDANVIVEHFKAGTEQGGVAEVPRGDAAVTIDRAAGRLAIALTNLHPDGPLECEVWAPGRRFAATGGVVTLTAPEVDDFNDVDHPTSVSPIRAELASTGERFTVTLPPRSVSVVEIGAEPW
ncbi:MAG TPA: alpha-L-arabinofuranosidase C-terminal domain-containing protein [Acidimicrobiales bacterium]|nr:alpha-L-arabinofuranosidase C-terminal domain-containing protein [Acidimicrobiales bacterium]